MLFKHLSYYFFISLYSLEIYATIVKVKTGKSIVSLFQRLNIPGLKWTCELPKVVLIFDIEIFWPTSSQLILKINELTFVLRFHKIWSESGDSTFEDTLKIFDKDCFPYFDWLLRQTNLLLWTDKFATAINKISRARLH